MHNTIGIITWETLCLIYHKKLISFPSEKEHFLLVHSELREFQTTFRNRLSKVLKRTVKAFDSNFVRNGGNMTRTHSSFCSWAGVSEQIANNVLL